MKVILQSFSLNVIFIIQISFKSFEEKKEMEGGGQSKMHFDSCIDSFTPAFRDFKSKFYVLLIRNMNTLFEPNKSNKEKICSQKIIQLPQANIFHMQYFKEPSFLCSS